MAWLPGAVAAVEATCQAELHYANVALDETLAADVTLDVDDAPKSAAEFWNEQDGDTMLYLGRTDDTGRWIEAKDGGLAIDRDSEDYQTTIRCHEMAKKRELRDADMRAAVALEERRKEFVQRNAENTRTLAEAEAHRLRAAMSALQSADPRIVQALAAAGMQPQQLIAQAFGGIAEKAEKIGQLNVSPELLQSLLAAPAAAPAAKRP